MATREGARVNGDLEFLLSRVFDGYLAPEHREDLAKSKITDPTITENYIRSVPPATIHRVLEFAVSPRVRSACLYPYRSPAGGFMDHARVKVFPPLTDGQGHTVKYLQRPKSAPRVYFVASQLERVQASDEPLWIAEGEKKALCLSQLGLPVIGIAGVEGWHVKGSDALLADFDAIRLEGRVVEVLPDGDYQYNVNVSRAVRRLGNALAARGARPRVVLLPREAVPQ